MWVKVCRENFGYSLKDAEVTFGVIIIRGVIQTLLVVPNFFFFHAIDVIYFELLVSARIKVSLWVEILFEDNRVLIRSFPCFWELWLLPFISSYLIASLLPSIRSTFLTTMTLLLSVMPNRLKARWEHILTILLGYLEVRVHIIEHLDIPYIALFYTRLKTLHCIGLVEVVHVVGRQDGLVTKFVCLEVLLSLIKMVIGYAKLGNGLIRACSQRLQIKLELLVHLHRQCVLHLWLSIVGDYALLKTGILVWTLVRHGLRLIELLWRLIDLYKI